MIQNTFFLNFLLQKKNPIVTSLWTYYIKSHLFNIFLQQKKAIGASPSVYIFYTKSLLTFLSIPAEQGILV